MTKVDATGATFQGTCFAESDLRGSVFCDVDATNADFQGCDLTGAVFASADISGANFSGANLTSADFRYAKLAEANFMDAVVNTVIATGTDVHGVQGVPAKLLEKFCDSSSSAAASYWI